MNIQGAISRLLQKFADHLFLPVGKRTIEATRAVTNGFALFFELFVMTFSHKSWRSPLLRKRIIEQIYFSALGGSVSIVITALATGGLLTAQFVSLTSHEDIGGAFVSLVIREMAPLITSLVVILRSGTSVVLETGAMRIGNEIESVEMGGIDPVWFFGFPRWVGIISAMVMLVVLFNITAIAGGGWIVWLLTGKPVEPFMDAVARSVHATEIISNIEEALFSGIAVSVICLYYGFTVRRHTVHLYKNVYRAVLLSFIWVLLIHTAFSFLFYL